MDALPLVRAVVAAISLLEHSSDAEIDPDVAVRGMENISHELLRMGEEDRAGFLLLLDALIQESPGGEEREFLLELPRLVGLDGDN